MLLSASTSLIKSITDVVKIIVLDTINLVFSCSRMRLTKNQQFYHYDKIRRNVIFLVFFVCVRAFYSSCFNYSFDITYIKFDIED